ncbi:YidC/Oxa1 family membrane protein insertase [Candidatus Saccharibacteria bacterium]|nr:YidC/Oxa1 family membrane protein insertase [Candidatus Saccharibacteria bacterium]
MFAFLDMVIVRPIVNILFVIYSLVGDFGLAIILFTVIVKLITWPLMKRQLHQTRIMRQIQPELAEIKKNCKGNRQLESIQMMDLYKRKNIKPFRSMLMLLIQFPIFIGLFTAINVAVRPHMTEKDTYTVEHSAYFFVEPMDHIDDLITQQKTYLAQVQSGAENPTLEFSPKLFGVVDLSATAGFTSISSVIILVFAIASSVTQFVMSRQQDPSRRNGKKRTMRQLMKEAADGKEASQEEINAVAQGQMTWMMPFMMFLIMANLPGALVFYYLLNNTITVILQKRILSQNYTEMEAAADKQILKELHNAEEAVIVDDRTIKREEKTTHYSSDNKNKKEKVHITRITASDKKKRR